MAELVSEASETEEFTLEVEDMHGNEQMASSAAESEETTSLLRSETSTGKKLQKRKKQIASRTGEILEENDVEQGVAANGNEVPVSRTVRNDLRVAAELELGQSGTGLQVIYPEASLNLAEHFDETLKVFVRLRDDANVCGMCTAVQGSTLLLSTDFGDFGDRATKLIQNEEKAAERESLLRKQRQEEINQQMNEEVSQTIRWRQKWCFVSIWVFLLILCTAMVACTVAAFSATELQGVGLTVALLGLGSCAGCALAGICMVAGVGNSRSDLRMAVQAAHPELQQFRDTGLDKPSLRSCICCVLLVVLGCMVAMTAANKLNGNGWALAVLCGLVALVMCFGGVLGWRKDERAGWGMRAASALCGALYFALLFPFLWLSWPWLLLQDCGFESRLTPLLLQPPKRLLDAAVHTTHDHTIVFEGNVLPGRETVCSWPGKYATAWDTLVAGSRKDDISAAVVFLPEGSKHFGLHDPIPPKEGLHGDCWCTPLYGECKPWGCRWWSKWIANIEKARSQGCTLVVYYFNSRIGKGKVKDFTTAGKEHLRREAIERCKDAFFKSEAFCNALEAGLKHLSEEKGPDYSSPYSREVHRLFLAWLRKEERQFLVSSEGLGNSQKAEVAWLERKGYPYIEKEVWELESSSPKAIGRADTLE